MRTSATRVAFRYSLAVRVAERHLLAADFEKFLKGRKFLNPDTGNKVQFGSLPESEQEKIRGKWEKDQKDVDTSVTKSWYSNLKGLGESAVKYLSEAPKVVKDFISDPEKRKEHLAKAREGLKNLPEKALRSAVKSIKAEAEDYSNAAKGVAAVLRGGEMSKEEHKALKSVALNVAVTVAGLSLSYAGMAGAAASFGKGMAKHLALRAVSDGMADANFISGIRDTGADFLRHITAKEKGKDKGKGEPDMELVIGKIVAELVSQSLQSMSDEDIADSLNSMEKDD